MDSKLGLVVVIPDGDEGRRSFDKLVKAAEDLFSQRGYRNTTIKDIVQSAGLSVGAFTFTSAASISSMFISCRASPAAFRAIWTPAPAKLPETPSNDRLSTLWSSSASPMKTPPAIT